MSVNIPQQKICTVISHHFAEKFCPENACCVMFTDICCHLTDITFLGVRQVRRRKFEVENRRQLLQASHLRLTMPLEFP